MFHTKQDVDRHVVEVFKNIKSEYQRNLKCYQIAKLYYKFNDYKSAIKYINRYILTTSNSAAAHKLLGECYLGMNLKLKALDSFKTSLELNGSQHDLILKICSLIMDPEVSAVMPRATYWLERAETLFPTSPVVFRLREHLLKTNLDGKQDNKQLEKLILSEVSARPSDVTVRIRLLNFFIDTHRYKIAYQHALEIEDRSSFPNDPRWYDCLCNLFQAYEKANTDLNFNFFIKKLIFLEKRADLFMQEFQNEVKTLSDCSSALFAFDQSLHSISKISVPDEEGHFFAEFMKHMRAQLSFHLATLALKRAKTEYGIWPKAFRTANPLLLQATQNTMDLEDAWYNTWVGKNKMDKEVKQFNKSACLRISQAGHILLAWSQNKGPQFLEKVSQSCGGKWQTRAYQDIFYNKYHQVEAITSHFINDPFFSVVPLRFLSEAELNRFDEVAQTAQPDSLHHLVWLGLANFNANGQLNHYFRCTTVPDLQFTVENLSQTGPETLNQLDVDAFLYASVLCAKSATSNTFSADRPSKLPVSISEELCSPAQAEWWSVVHKMYKNQSSNNIADVRLKLKKGIETIRAFGQHGLHVKLIVLLAKLFQERAAKNKNAKELIGLEERAYFYWSVAIPLLERIEKNQQTRDICNRLFDYKGKDLTSNEVKGHLEDGKLFLGCRLMKQGRYEQAIETFQSLKSPYASFYQGLIYKKLASEEVNDRPESITSENRSQHIILLTRAREAFYLTLDRLRCPSVDPNHPLNEQLQDDLEEIEKQLAIIDPDNSLNKNGDTESEGTDTAVGHLSPDVDETLDASFNVFNANNLLSVKSQVTPRISKRNLSDRHLITRMEARPSPERLEAQLRHLVQANSNGLQAVVEQLKEMKAVIQVELKDLGCVTRDLLAEMKRWNDRVAFKRGADSIKVEELFDLREEDYDDINQFSQPYASYQNYHLNRQMINKQVNPSQTYGASVQSPIPPVPPMMANQENPLLPQTFYHASVIPPIDSSVLSYQTLGFYPQGLPYGDNQNVPDYRGSGIQKGVSFGKNSYRAPDNSQAPIMSTILSNPTTIVGGINTKAQSPNVVITSSDTLPAFTSSVVTPAMSVTIPLQHIKSGTFPVTPQKTDSNQVHPYQIQMPPQAHLVKESPTEKLNSIIPSTTSSIQTNATSVTILPATLQITPNKDTGPLKSTAPVNNLEKVNKKPETEYKVPEKIEQKLFDSKAKLSLFVNNEWKLKGDVSVKIFQDESLNKARIICQQTFYSYIDHFFDTNSSLEPFKIKENGWVCTVNNTQKRNIQERKPSRLNDTVQKFCLIFSSLDEAKDFEFAFNQGLKTMKNVDNLTKNSVSANSTEEKKTNLCSGCGQLFEGTNEKCSSCALKDSEKPISKESEKPVFGGFTFLSKPIVEPAVAKVQEKKEKLKETTTPSPFANLSLSTIMNKESNPTKSEEDKNLSKSENLFANVKKDPNSFNKPENFNFEGQNSLVFGNLNKPKTPISKTSLKDDEEGDDDFVPTAEFAPVVDLPDLVDVRTGEENDEVLFNERVKLLRFDTNLKEWKERGIGNMKLLLNKESGKVRLIMRREVVLKVCCNHYLDDKMKFKMLTKSKNALTWYAQDYSEGDFTSEYFCLRFKSTDLMMKFMNVIENTQSKMKDGRIEGMGSNEPKEEKKEDLKPLAELFKPKAGEWECSVCFVRNQESAVKCVSCEASKPGSEKAAATTEITQPKGLGKGIVFPPTTTLFTFGIPNQSVSTSSFTTSNISTPAEKFTFGTSPTTATSSSNPTGFVFGISNSGIQTANSKAPNSTFSPNTPTAAYTSSTKSKNTTGGNTVTISTSTPSFTFSFGLGSSTPTSTSSTITNSLTATNVFTPKSNATFEKSGNIFGGTSLKKSEEQQNSPFSFSNSKAEQSKSISSISTPQTSFSFAAGQKPEGKENFEFKFDPTKFSTANDSFSKKDDSNVDAGTSDASDVEQDSDSSFNIKPIVSLPEKVEMPTGEEDEDVIYSHKAKLFRFYNSEWKERGIGDVKILKHKTNNKIRLLMRRDTILKVCLNHYVDNIDFVKKDEKTWRWSSPDFSEGEVRFEIFAMRFKNSEIADNFMKTLEDVRKTGNAKPLEKDLSESMKNFTFSTPFSQSSAKTLTPFKGIQEKTLDDDISITYENTVTAEQREKAISLQLPPKFYAYLQAPDCPGCEGCEDKEDLNVASLTTQQSTFTAATSTTTFTTTTNAIFSSTNTSVKPNFGNSSWGTFTFNGDGNFKNKILFSFAGNQAGKVTNKKENTNFKENLSSDKNDYIEDDDGVDEYEDEDEDDDEDEDGDDDDNDNDDDEDDDDDDDEVEDDAGEDEVCVKDEEDEDTTEEIGSNA